MSRQLESTPNTRKTGFRAARRVGAGLLALAWVVAAGSAAAAAGKARSSILQYDSGGRVIGVESVTVGDPSRGAGRTAPAKPSDGIGRAAGEGLAPLGDNDFIAGEIVVALSGDAVLRRARRLGFRPLEQVALPALDLVIARLKVPLAAGTRDALQAFRRAFPGADADLNSLYGTAARTVGWDAVSTVGWPGARRGCGAGLRLGMIDTAIDTRHPALATGRVEARSFLKPSQRPARSAHGTAVASLLVGNPETQGFGGLLPGAELLAAAVFKTRDDGRTVADLVALMKALDWLTRERVHVINMSLAGGQNTILTRAINRTVAKGVVVVAAAGNGGAGARPAFPAAYPNVLAVTAIGPELNPYRFANRGSYIDFAAPGVGIWTAVPGGGKFQSGTSFAVPFVTAIAVLQIASGVSPNAVAMRASLADAARDLGRPGKDDIFGWGLVRYAPNCR